MISEYRFTIPGKPVGKGRPKFARRGNYVQTYTPEATAVYENWVRDCWSRGNFPKLTGEIHATIAAVFPIPKSASKKRREAMAAGEINPQTKPDLDNIAKAVLDSLNGLAYDDDSQVTRLSIQKCYDVSPRCVVMLHGETEAPAEEG